MKVLEPSAGQYEVIVRMDPTMASKFPDKPFGTAITEIGLAAKDTAKYAGYTLVSIEPADKGAKDHYWIFQKLPGTAWTTEERLAIPINGYLYTTTQDVPRDATPPAIGSTMESVLGPEWADSLVVAAFIKPNNGKGEAVIRHARIPSVADQIANCKSWTHTTSDIGGQKFSGISITLVMLGTEYSETTPAIGSVLGDLDSGAIPSQFAESSYILEGRGSVSVVSELEPIFRAEKRSFIKRVAMTQNDFDEALGGNLQSVQTLYFRGESISGGTGTAQVESVTVGGAISPGVASSCTLRIAVNPTEVEAVVGVAASVELSLPDNPVEVEAVSAAAANATLTVNTNPVETESTPAVAASASYRMANVPSPGDTVTIDSVTFTFVNAASTSTNISISAGTLANAKSEFLSVVNAHAGVGGTASSFVSDVSTFTWDTAGAVGNSIDVSDTHSFGTPRNGWDVTPTTLSGGSDAIMVTESITINGNVFYLKNTPTLDNHIQIGATVADTRANIVSTVNAEAIGVSFAAFVGSNSVLTWGTTGTVGNGKVVSETMVGTGNSWSAASLAGGLNAVTAVVESVTIDGNTFEFRNSAGAGEVQIGATAANTQANLRSVVNAASIGGSFAPFVSDLGVYTHGTSGVVGNGIEVSASLPLSGGSWMDTELTGGVDAVSPVVETLTINGTVFSFKNTVVAPGDVKIEATVNETRESLRTAINASAAGGSLTIWYGDEAVYFHGVSGTAGNSIAIAETMAGTNNGWASGATSLGGGVNSTAASITATFTAATGLTGSPVSVTVPTYDTDSLGDIANRIAVALDSNPAIYAKALASVSGDKASLTYRVKAADAPSDSLTLTLGSTGLTATPSDIDGAVSTDTIEAIFADKANSFWGVQGDFTAREGQQLSDDWFAVTRRQVIPSRFSTSGRSYYSTADHLWPAVLSTIQIDIWNRIEGGSDMFTIPIYAKEAYRGPCRAYVEERFYLSPPPMEAPKVMLPLPIDLQTPVFGLNIGPTLHTARGITLNTGTNHPVYEYSVGSWNFPATTPTSWPSSVVASDECRPFRGGYIKTKVTVYPPSF
jgi:hypothetical protein